jgi:tetratricopeptide (TPR) repeat protein
MKRKNKNLIITVGALLVLSGISVSAQNGSGDSSPSFHRGIEYTNKGEYDRAIREFSRVITEDQDYAGAYLALAIVYVNKKMDVEAIELLKKSIDLDPNTPRSYFMLARIYERIEEDNKAIQTWEKFLSLDPKDPYASQAKKRIKRLKEKN